jgi:hypothetical protein
MNLLHADELAIRKALRRVREMAERVEQQLDTQAAREAVLAVRTACLRAAQAITAGEDNARQAALQQRDAA